MGPQQRNGQHLSKAFNDPRLASVYTRYRTPPSAAIEIYRQCLQNEIDLIAARGESVHIADVGAGSGLYIRPLFAGLQALDNYIAIEPAEAMADELCMHITACKLGVHVRQGIPLSDPLPNVNVVWISDVAHLFKTPHDLINAAGLSFPNVQVYIIRNNTKDTIARVDWSKYFPSLLTEDIMRQPTEQSIVAALVNIGAEVVLSTTVDESFDLPRDEYVQYYASRPFSGIRLLDENRFAVGMKNLISDTADKTSIKRILTRHLIVARRQRV